MNRKKITIALTELQARALIQVAGEALAGEWDTLADYTDAGLRGVREAQNAVNKIRALLPEKPWCPGMPIR